MDKYIKMLLIALSQCYKATVTIVMGFNEETGSFFTIHKLLLSNKETKKPIHQYDAKGKRDLVSEMMKWVNQTQ